MTSGPTSTNSDLTSLVRGLAPAHRHQQADDHQREADREVPRAQLEHERLCVYRKALSFLEQLETLGSLPGEYELRDQLRRASASIVLNLAEGASRQSPADKRRFYLIARGSLGEVGAALDILRIRRRISPARHAELRAALVEIARMLGGMTRQLS